jgi:hypothetical protein
MKQGPRWVRLMKKTRSRKSRATVPLKRHYSKKKIVCVQTEYKTNREYISILL